MGQLQAAASRNNLVPLKSVWIILLLTQVVPQGGASWSEPQGNWVKESATGANSKFVRKHHPTPAETVSQALKVNRHYDAVNHYPVLSHSAGCNIHVHSEGEAMVQLQDDMMYAMSPSQMWTAQTWHKPLECSDVLCLVQGLLAREPQIILLDDINVSESLPLPEVFGKTTIIGTCGENPCMIDGGGMGQIFVVGVGGMLTLKDLEITGGACSEGSAVLVSGKINSRGGGGRLLALNVLFHNNTASGSGGAVMVKAGGLAHIRSCVFEDNMASKGAALYVGSVQQYPMVPLGRKCGLSTCVTVVNTAFWRNQASWGGAIYVDDAPLQCSRDGGAKFECTTCSFVNNTAWVDGGAILLAYVSSGAIGHVKMATFHNNTAMRSGGDVELQPGRRFTHGVEFDAYMTEFSGTDATGDRAVAVKDFASANFVKCREQDDSAIYCGGRTCGFCPNKQYQYSMPPSTNLFLNDSSNGMRIPNAIDFNVTIMKPTFGIHGSGANYVNFQVAELKVSPMVHGILGQTYQETKDVYMKLHNAHAHRMTPSQAARVFIDGSEDDYITSGIFAADCKFCKFEDQKPFPANMKRNLLIKAKQMLSSEKDDEELVRGCAGIGDPTALCVNLIDNWFN